MRTNPTIVDDIVLKMHNRFKRVYVVNRNTKDSYSKIINLPNVSILEVEKRNRLLMIPYSMTSMFRKENLDDIFYAIRTHRFCREFVVRFAKYVHITNLLHQVLKKIKEINGAPEKVTLLAIWFTSEACAIARIKDKHPGVKGISMAHAHEVESFDNKFTFFGKKYSQRRLDKVCFISKAKMDVYKREVCIERNIDTSNLVVAYWGSEFVYFPIKEQTEGASKRVIVSCSTVQDLKRVNMIAEAVSLIGRDDLEWYHFGDGPLMNDLKERISKYDTRVRKRIHLLGRRDNLEVKEFYASHNVDLFINVSTTEGLPISVMEAMSYSIPVLVTDVGGEREIVDHGENGYIVPVDISSTDLAKCIESHLDKEASCLYKMRDSARRKWEKKFNLERNIEFYIKELLI